MKKAKFATLSAAVALATAMPTAPVSAQSEPLIGQLTLFGYDWCPRNWARADGQLLAISQNTALFSLYGTTYGGDGRTTFALPDLRGRVPIHDGRGPGLTNYNLGQVGGVETVTLVTPQIPAHSHSGHIVGSNVTADKSSTNGTVLARTLTSPTYAVTTPDTAMANGTVQTDSTGGSQPHENRMPYLAMNWCVALYGVFPSRN
jgi:microcystin-dependent protein|tara:strand:+ start:8646 stop:9254 length:609 start_codon:yes stop_codon:yes gene_type:complete